MDQQHRKIVGYRELSQAEIDTINSLKKLGLEIKEGIDELATLPEVDQRWLAIGRTHMQEGLMAIIRSIAKPEGL